jgi:predicted small secreted protein
MKTRITFRKSVRFAIVAAGCAALGGLSACNTTRGLGRDVQKVGSKIEQKADQHQRY